MLQKSPLMPPKRNDHSAFSRCAIDSAIQSSFPGYFPKLTWTAVDISCLNKSRIHFLPVEALSHFPTKSSVLHQEILSQQHWAAKTSKSVLAMHPPSQPARAGAAAMLLVSVLLPSRIYIHTYFLHIWKCWFHPKQSELVFLHVPATSLHAIVLHDEKGKEMVSWLAHFTSQHVAWHQNTVIVPFHCTSHPHLKMCF